MWLFFGMGSQHVLAIKNGNHRASLLDSLASALLLAVHEDDCERHLAPLCFDLVNRLEVDPPV